MIIESSAVIALLAGEPERATVLAMAESARGRLVMSAVSYVECAAVIDRRGDPVLSRRYDELLAALDVSIIPVSVAQARIARGAYRDFGKGSGHPAGLNFGDCFPYALAIERGQPLLFVGDDFSHTDVEPAISRQE
ncbi:MAG: type II toxin-antitoxin system VapC family toxin [Nakamurella sp.]